MTTKSKLTKSLTQAFSSRMSVKQAPTYYIHPSLASETIHELSSLQSRFLRGKKQTGLAGLPVGYILPKTDVVDELQMFDEIQRWINIQMIVPQIFIGLLIVGYTNICFDNELLYFEDSVSQCPDAMYLKACAWFMYLIFFHRLCDYYAISAEREVLKWGFNSRWQAFRTSGIGYFCVEALVNAVIPFPGMEGLNIESSLFFIFVFFRVYLLVRCARDFSILWIQRHKIQRLTNFKDKGGIDSFTVLIAFFHNHTLFSIAFLLIFGLLVLAYNMHQLERHIWVRDNFDYWDMQDEGGVLPPADSGWEPSAFNNFFSCCWFSVVTASTVGYGDFAPRTPSGRFVAACTILYGLIVTSLLSGVVINGLEPTNNDIVATNWRRHTQAAMDMQEAAARIVQITWRKFQHYKNKAKKRTTALTAKQKRIKVARHNNRLLHKIKAHVKKLKKARKTFLETQEAPPPLREVLTRRSNILHAKFSEFEDILRKSHPEKMAEYEDNEYKERVRVAVNLLRAALRAKRENDELRHSNKMRVRSLSSRSMKESNSQLVSLRRGSQSMMRRGSQSISRVTQASLIRSDSAVKQKPP